MGNGSEGPSDRVWGAVGVPRAPGWCSPNPIEQHPLTNGIMQIDAKSKFAGAPRRLLGPCLGFELIKATMGREIRKLLETTGWTHRIWICVRRICAVIAQGCGSRAAFWAVMVCLLNLFSPPLIYVPTRGEGTLRISELMTILMYCLKPLVCVSTTACVFEGWRRKCCLGCRTSGVCNLISFWVKTVPLLDLYWHIKKTISTDMY